MGGSEEVFEGERMPLVMIGAGLVVILSNFMALLSFPFSIRIPWHKKTNPLVKVSPPFSFNFSFIREHSYQIMLWGIYACVLVSFILMHTAYLYVSTADTIRAHRYLWKLANLVLWLATSLLLVPFNRSMISVYNCETPVNSTVSVVVEDNSIECWEPYHAVLCVFSGVCLALFLFMSLRLVFVNSELSRAAVYFWTNWTFDRPSVGHVHLLSLRSALFARTQLLLEIALICISLFLNKSASNRDVAIAFLVISIMLIVATFMYPPYWK